MIWFFAVCAVIFASGDFDSFNGTEEYDDAGNETDGLDFAFQLPVQTNLSKILFNEGYDKEVSPVPENHDMIISKKWGLILQFHRLKLMEVDEPNEQVTVVSEVTQTWEDPRLAWDKEQHQNLSAFYTRLEKVWSPPFTVYAASEVVEHRDQNYRLVKVSYDGMISAHIPMKIKINCKLNMLNFPFDTQVCEIRTGVASFNSHLYTVFVELSEDITNSCLLGNSAWDVMTVLSGSQKVKTNDAWFDDTNMGVVKILLKRNPVYYMYMIVLPTFIINALSTAGVFLKNTNKIDRLTIGLTHIMTMTFILGIVADKLPKTEHIPLLGKYIIFSLGTMIVSLAISTYLKKISGALAKKLEDTRSSFGQKFRKFIGSPLRVIFIVIFQTANIVAVGYILARWIHFDNVHKFDACVVRENTMEIQPEITIDCGCP